MAGLRGTKPNDRKTNRPKADQSPLRSETK